MCDYRAGNLNDQVSCLIANEGDAWGIIGRQAGTVLGAFKDHFAGATVRNFADTEVSSLKNYPQSLSNLGGNVDTWFNQAGICFTPGVGPAICGARIVQGWLDGQKPLVVDALGVRIARCAGHGNRIADCVLDQILAHPGVRPIGESAAKSSDLGGIGGAEEQSLLGSSDVREYLAPLPVEIAPEADLANVLGGFSALKLQMSRLA